MWKLLKYMKAYKKEAVCAPLFKLLEALFELFVPLVMAKIIDIGIAQGDRPVHCADVSSDGGARPDRPGVLDHGAVFFSKSSGRICGAAAP